MKLAFSGWQVLLSVVGGLLLAWIALVIFLVLARPKGARLKEALGLLSPVLKLIGRLVTDRSLAFGIRVLRRHWPGTADGLAVLWWVAGLPGSADQSPSGAGRPHPAG